MEVLAVIIGGLLGYLSGRLLEFRKQLVLQKGQAYGDYLRALATSAVLQGPRDSILAATDAKVRICIYGSPEVAEKLALFEAAGAKIIDDAGKAAISNLVVAMRKDVGAGRIGVGAQQLQLILFGPTKGP
jgi:hypothetical protein